MTRCCTEEVNDVCNNCGNVEINNCVQGFPFSFLGFGVLGEMGEMGEMEWNLDAWTLGLFAFR